MSLSETLQQNPHKPTNIFETKEWQEYDYYMDLVEDEELAEVKPVGKEWLSWHTPWYLCERVKLHPEFIMRDGVFYIYSVNSTILL